MSKNRIFSYENLVVVLMGTAFGFVFFDRLALNFLSPFLVPELHLNNTQLGALAAGLALTWAIAGYAVGTLSDYFQNRKKLLVCAIVIFSICSVGSGLANSFLTLLAARLVMGFAEGPVLPIAQSIMAAESSEHRRGFNMGVLQNFFSALLSNFAAPLVLVAIGQIYGWRSAFYIAAVPGFVVAALIVAFIREPSSSAAPISTASARNTIPLSAMLKHRNIWVCAVVSCLMVSWLLIQITFLPIYLVQVRGLSPSAMSVAVAATGIATAASSILVPALSDRFGRRPILVLSGLVGVIAPVTTVMFDGPLPLMVLFMGIGYLAIGSFSLFMATVPSETIPPTHVATALGFIMGVGELAGGFAGPALAGIASDVFGPSSSMWIAATLCICAGLLCLMLDETAPRVRERHKRMIVSSPA
ncbi:MFS transporter [Bradyrhizobium zhanjiangense]|uniref:MFS transporter n=1 Tax=Bradyrhizobium zhanjiangense TaxID=1325107 RepID=A0A4Q0QR23_9BRAD|nr:MFS transporter [Bradyrhizobium zhanjiangense]RXG99451.1 MFS transporter [Bradyrhizobium zhanjiangense]